MSLSAAHNDGGIGCQLPPRLLRFSLLYPHRPILIPSLDIDPYLNLDARRVGQFPSKPCLLQQFGSIQAPATEQALQRRQPIGPCRGENVPIPHYHGDVLQERQPRPWRRHLQQDFRAWALSAELSSLEEHVPQVHQTRRALDEGIVEGDQLVPRVNFLEATVDDDRAHATRVGHPDGAEPGAVVLGGDFKGVFGVEGRGGSRRI